MKKQLHEQNLFSHLREQPKKHEMTSSFLKSFFTSFAVISVLVLLFYLPDIKNLAIDAFRRIQGKNTARFELKLPFSPRRQNILVLGTDISHSKNDFKGVRSDSISLVSIAPYAKDVNIISIPRDSKVYFSNSNRADKINHAFAKGGIDLTIDTIEETFGVRIDHYVIFSTKALVDFIDEIGGLPIYVEKDMHYGDSTSQLFIDLSKGHQILSGKQAEEYMRFRNDHLGDIGRIMRQQWFFNALAEKLKQPKTFILLPEAIKKSMEHVKTDMSFYQIVQMAGIIKMIDHTKIKTIVLPGTPSSKDTVSYWILDPEKTQQIINSLVYRDTPPILDRPLSVGVLYTKEGEGFVEGVKTALDNENCQLKTVERKHLNRNQISVHNVELSMDKIDEIQKKYPELENFPITYDLVGFNRAGKDLTIIFANNGAKNSDNK